MYEKLVEQLGSYSKIYRSGETLGRAIQYTEDLLDEASAAIETLETLLQNYESAIDTKKRLAAKIEQLQSELEQVKRERDAAVNEIKACYDIQGIDDYYPIYDLGICMCCSHYSDDVDRANGEELACGDCQNASNWQWRGAKEGKHDV